MEWGIVVNEIRDMVFGCTITNAHGVEFWFFPVEESGRELILACNLTVLEGVLSCSKWYDSVEEFTKDHGLFDEDDIDKVTPADLMKRFEKGEARLCCKVDGDQSLWFRRVDVLLYAEDCQDERHLVSESLVNAEDYVRYTKGYYGRKVKS